MRFRLVSILVALTALIAVMMSCEVEIREDGSRDMTVVNRYNEQGMAIPSQFEILEETMRTIVFCHKPSGVVYLANDTKGGLVIMVDAEGKPLTREYFTKKKDIDSNSSLLGW